MRSRRKRGKNGGEGNGMIKEARASTPRAGPKSDPCTYRVLCLGSAGGNRCPGPASTSARVQTGSWLPALPTPPFIKRIDNKRRAGAEKWGRGNPKSSKSFRVRGWVLLSPPFQLLRLSEGDPRTRSGRYLSPDNSHIGTGIHTHLCTQTQVRGDTHSASALPSKQPE